MLRTEARPLSAYHRSPNRPHAVPQHNTIFLNASLLGPVSVHGASLGLCLRSQGLLTGTVAVATELQLKHLYKYQEPQCPAPTTTTFDSAITFDGGGGLHRAHQPPFGAVSGGWAHLCPPALLVFKLKNGPMLNASGLRLLRISFQKKVKQILVRGGVNCVGAVRALVTGLEVVVVGGVWPCQTRKLVARAKGWGASYTRIWCSCWVLCSCEGH